MWQAVMEGVHGLDWRKAVHGANAEEGLASDDAAADAAAVPEVEHAPSQRGGGSRSQFADTASSGRLSPEELRRPLLFDIAPLKETLAEFSTRIDRIAVIISMREDPVSQLVLGEIKIKAEYMLLLHGLAGDTQITFLKDQMQDVLITQELEEGERHCRGRQS